MWIWIAVYFIGFAVCYCGLMIVNDFDEDIIFENFMCVLFWPVIIFIIGLGVILIGFNKILKKVCRWIDRRIKLLIK